MQYDITFHPSWWHQYGGIEFTQNFFDDPDYRLDCDVKMRKLLYDCFGQYGLGEKDPKPRPILGSDLLAAGYLHSQLFGCPITYTKDQSPQVHPLHLDEDAISDVLLPDLDTNPIWQNTQTQIDYLKNKFGYVIPCINLMGIQNIALDLMGEEVFLAYYTAQEEVTQLLHKITTLSLNIGKRLSSLTAPTATGDISGGVTSIIRTVLPNCYVTSNCSVDMISNELYENFLLEQDQILANTFTSFGIHHCGSTMEHVLDGYKKIKNISFLEVGAGSNLQQVRNTFPNTWLNARYSPVRLQTASQQEITQEIEMLAHMGYSKKGLLSISCVGIDSHTSVEQVSYFLKSCQNL